MSLFDEFGTPTLEQWQEEVIRLLKGKPYEKTLLTPTVEGIPLNPMYTEADLEGLEHLGTPPGSAPYVRASRPLGYREENWWVAQELPYPTPGEFQEALAKDLPRGQTAVNLVLDEATQRGQDPQQAEEGVGIGGTSISCIRDLATALKGVKLDTTPLLVQGGSAAVPFAALVMALMRQRGSDTKAFRGSLGFDPLSGLAQHGELPVSLDRACDELALLTRWAQEHAPHAKTIAVYGHPYADAGASSVQELGFMIATAVEYLRRLEERGLEPEETAPRFFFGTSVGTHFFMEIAKLRAARMVWARVVEAAGGSEAARKMTLHARTSRYTKTAWDPYVNLLRGTTEAFSAVMGGADSLHVAPFDEPLGVPSEFSRRIARNTQVMLREEAHFDAVVDPAGGSWYVENLTDQVARKSWELFQQIEAAGGMARALEEGLPQRLVADTATERRERLAVRKDVLVGVNTYANPAEEPLGANPVDEQAVRKTRIEELETLQESASQDAHAQVMEKLHAIFQVDGPEAFEALIQAAQSGATIGEFTSTLRQGAQARPGVTPLSTHRAAEPFERLRSAVRGWQQASEGPDVFCLNLGPVGSYMPRLDFTRGYYQVAGFRVAAEEWFEGPEEAVAAYTHSGAPVAVIVGLDTTYLEQAVETVKGARESGGARHIVLAGMPKDILEELKQAGVDEFIHIKSDLLKSLENLAQTLGVER